jgi:hypothetical protein
MNCETHLIYDEANNEDDLYDVDEESDDSPLKEIYTGQTFITFEVLEKCLD